MASNAFATGEGFGPPPANRKIIDVIHRYGRFKPAQNARNRRAHGDGLKCRLLRRMRQITQRAVEPSIFRGLHARSACLHKILRIEVGAAGVGRSGRMHNRQLTLLPQRLKRRKRRMQAKESVKIKHSLARNVDAGPHGVILRIAVRHHNIQTVGSPTLEDHDQPLGAQARLSRAQGRTRKKTRHRSRTGNGKRTVANKNATSNSHKVP